MTAGETKPATAIRPLKGPSHMLHFTRSHTLTHCRITAVGAVTPLHSFLGCHIRKNRCHTLHIRGETHMKIPLVICLKRLNALSDRMLWQLFKISNPMRVYRPVCLKTTALPLDKFLVALIGGGLNRIMNSKKANPLIHQFGENF